MSEREEDGNESNVLRLSEIYIFTEIITIERKTRDTKKYDTIQTYRQITRLIPHG